MGSASTQLKFFLSLDVGTENEKSVPLRMISIIY
jgi:hypothetical protein